MGDARRRRELGLGDGMERTVAQLHDALLDAEHLRRILMMPEFERERILADLPNAIRAMAPGGGGVEYRMARTWYDAAAKVIEDRIRGGAA